MPSVVPSVVAEPLLSAVRPAVADRPPGQTGRRAPWTARVRLRTMTGVADESTFETRAFATPADFAAQLKTLPAALGVLRKAGAVR